MARDSLKPVFQSTLDQWRTQRIIKDSGDGLSYLDAAALLKHEKKMARGGCTTLAVIVPVLIAVAVAVVLAIRSGS